MDAVYIEAISVAGGTALSIVAYYSGWKRRVRKEGEEERAQVDTLHGVEARVTSIGVHTDANAAEIRRVETKHDADLAKLNSEIAVLRTQQAENMRRLESGDRLLQQLSEMLNRIRGAIDAAGPNKHNNRDIRS